MNTQTRTETFRLRAGNFNLLVLRLLDHRPDAVLPSLGDQFRKAPGFLRFAPIAIGLALTLVHLISIPVTNTSVNPARSTGPALFVGGWALGQLWLFWVAPLIGGALGGIVYRWLSPQPDAPVVGGVRSPG